MRSSRLSPVLEALLVAVALSLPVSAVAETKTMTSSELDTLVVVNGDAITNADIDALIMKSHGSLDMTQETNALLSRLLEKAVNDRLILQDAAAMGLHDDPEVLEPVTESSIQREINLYQRENFQPPREVSQEAIKEYFQKFYHRIHLRQISLRTKEEVETVIGRLRDGEDMDTLARAMSLDTRRIHGGLHNFKHWADLEIPLREASEGLPVGALSEPFPYREAWAVVRVEDRRAPDWAELPEHESFIRAQILTEDQKEAWVAFVDSLLGETPVRPVESTLESIRADADLLFDAAFKKGSDDPALVLDDQHLISEAELRAATSRNAMEMGDQPFEEIFATTLERESEQLVLQFHAEQAGYPQHPDIVAAFDRQIEDLMLKTYLNETVVSKIRFNHAELDSFYQEHKEEFRGPEEVRLGFIFFDELERARETAERLADGADWNYVKREIEGGGHRAEKTKYAPLKMFSEPVIEAVESMGVGETSDPVVFNGRWMVLRLEGRKEGDPLPRAEVEMPVRNAVFQLKFQEYLDEQLDLLKERSEIVRREDSIRRYLSAES